MNEKILEIVSDEKDARLKLTFPSSVVSTNIDAIREQLAAYSESVDAKINKWKRLELDFMATDFVDSIGLNLIFELVKIAEEKKAEIVALLKSRAVRLIFYTVRLDKKMDIRLIEAGSPTA